MAEVLNKGARKALAKLKEGYKYPKRDLGEGDVCKVHVDKVYLIDDGDKSFSGTAKRIVLDMRFWDTGMGRCSNNAEYMELVTSRIEGLPVYEDEVSFLKALEQFGYITIELPS